MSFLPYLDLAASVKGLSEPEMSEAMTLIMEGAVSEDDMAAFLTSLAQRGETVDEITGAARVLRSKAATIKAPEDALDCCGTGGDGIGTYNISTAVALVAAACGVPVAKHGNRAASSKSGAADVLEALGVNLDVQHDKLTEALGRFNFCFLMAPRHHEAVKHVVPVRKKLGFRTIFNLLGPLANPAETRYQLMGVFDEKWLVPLAQTLERLGSKRAWIVHGSDGLDEITVTGPTRIAILDQGMVSERELVPSDFGLTLSPAEGLLGGSADENAQALQALLEGDRSAYRDIVIANTAGVLAVHHEVPLKKGAALAAEALDSGASLDLLARYREFVA